MHAYQPSTRDVGGSGEASSTVRGTAPVSTVETHRANWQSATDLRSELLRAELAGELAEFNALSFHAILAMVEGGEGTDDYLDMAEAVAETERELAIVAGMRTTRDHLQRSVISGHSGASGDEAAELWRSVLLSLAQLAPRPSGIRRTK